jgi:hypothetical protein
VLRDSRESRKKSMNVIVPSTEVLHSQPSHMAGRRCSARVRLWQDAFGDWMRSYGVPRAGRVGQVRGAAVAAEPPPPRRWWRVCRPKKSIPLSEDERPEETASCRRLAGKGVEKGSSRERVCGSRTPDERRSRDGRDRVVWKVWMECVGRGDYGITGPG